MTAPDQTPEDDVQDSPGFVAGYGYLGPDTPSVPVEGRPGGWVEGVGWVAKLHALDVGTTARLGDIGGPFVVSVVDRVQIPGNPIAKVVRWADGTEPAPPPVPEADAMSDRDAMWCGALIGALNIDQMSDVLALFERIRSGEQPLPDGWIAACPAPPAPTGERPDTAKLRAISSGHPQTNFTMLSDRDRAAIAGAADWIDARSAHPVRPDELEKLDQAVDAVRRADAELERVYAARHHAGSAYDRTVGARVELADAYIAAITPPPAPSPSPPEAPGGGS